MTSRPFILESELVPRGDQPKAIRALVDNLALGLKHQVLLGATGTGKTYVMAKVIEETQRPALVLAHNKTLAAQLYAEFSAFFPQNAVEYFVSYYDYYQPEAYIPSTHTYIAKDASVNDTIDRMRHSATRSLLERNDVIIVASVSCIYGLGDKDSYLEMIVPVTVGETIRRDSFLRRLVDIQYRRNDYDFHRGTFRVRGDTVEIYPTYAQDEGVRIEFWGDEVEAISRIDPITGHRLEALDTVTIFPGSHYVTPAEQMRRAIIAIQDELAVRLHFYQEIGKHEEAERIRERTLFDVERMEQWGFCTGIENYSRHLTGRVPNQAPPVLLDYFPPDFLCFVDESHRTLPQVGAMFRGDRSRKQTLVAHGFRLPSALDNRPLKFNEFEARVDQIIHVSATPNTYELEQAAPAIHDLVIRPTGLLDPEIEIRPVASQVDDLLEEIRLRVARQQRVLVTTLTKRMAEHLAQYYGEVDVRVRYIHSDIKTEERYKLLTDLRRGEYDVLVGVNLLREGLDLPEVGLVAILDADKAGMLRSRSSLVQTIGRAARNVEGKVIMYADRITDAMAAAIDETDRRRVKQRAFNEAHGIEPRSVIKAVPTLMSLAGDEKGNENQDDLVASVLAMSDREFKERVEAIRKDMWAAATNRDFEQAARLRDKLKSYETMYLVVK
jgi:excinuclease ABC subunit B